MFIDTLFTRTRIALPSALGAALIFLSAAGPGFADPPTLSPAGSTIDPPGAVGRLSYMDGTVSFHAADQDQWSPAVLNFPVTSGNSFWTDANSRAEIEIGPVEIRMDQTTAVDITKLDDTGTQVEIEQGIVNVHLHTLPSGGVTVVTPRGNVMLLQPGSYHIDAGHPSGDTLAPTDQVQVTVLEGKAELDGPRSSLDVGPGETAVESGDPTTFTLSEGNATSFDDWALSREQSERAAATPLTSSPTITWNGPRVAPAPSQTLQYVSPQVTGYQDLDTYGQWDRTPDYGAVWYPTQIAVDWAPYRYGHWAFIAPWGWTWIDDAPWGFAPFHYGRWVRIHDRWGWCPGEIVARPVYAPALVAFIGDSNFGISISIGHSFPAVGWVPLGPREEFHPWYHASPAYVRNVNITNVTVVNNITVEKNVTVNNFVNQQAATVVSASAFTGAAPINRARVEVAHDELARTQMRSQLTHLNPTPAARAGIAVQEAATVDVAKPGTEGKIVAAPAVPATPATAQSRQADQATERTQVPAAFTVPKSPGPAFRTRAARPAVSTSTSTSTPGSASTPAATGAAQPSNRAQPENAPTNAPKVESAPATESQTKPLPEVVHGPPPIRHGENRGTMSNGTTPNASPSTPERATLQTQPGPKAQPQATTTPNTPSVSSPNTSLPNASMPNAATHNAAPGPEIRHGEQPVPGSTMTPSAPAITRHEQAIQGSTPTPSGPAITRHEQAIQGSTPPAAPEVVRGSPPREAIQAAPAPRVESAPAPAAEIRHPAQATHLAPTTEGWKRQAGPPDMARGVPAAAPAPKAAAPEVQKKAEPAPQQPANHQGPQDHGTQDRGPNRPGQMGQ